MQKLSDEEVVAILNDRRIDRVVAAAFGVRQSAITRIRNGTRRATVAPHIERGHRYAVGASLIEVLVNKSRYDECTGCLNWEGARGSHGYGMISRESELLLVHRASFETFVRPIPQDAMVLHHCDNRVCWQPSHLFLGDDAANSADKVSKDRHGRGTRMPNAKLDEASVPLICADRRRQVVVAREYGVHPSIISRVKAKKRWRHVT